MGGSPFYSMHNLMNMQDISALSALKREKSRQAFFKKLAMLTDSIQAFIDEFPISEISRTYDILIFRLSHMQIQLMDIGAAPTIWKIEILVNAIQTHDAFEIRDAYGKLIDSLKDLCKKLDGARIDTPDARPIKKTEPQDKKTGLDFSRKGREEAPVNFEQFEKLAVLIDNFEADFAIEQLRAMMVFFYTAEIDESLKTIYNYLNNFNYDAAQKESKKLLKSLKNTGINEAEDTKKKILAIDDMPVVLNSLKSMLKGFYHIYGVTNYMSAIKFLSNNNADLIIMDIGMPDMDGFTLLSIIRKFETYKDTPVIFLTGSASPDDVKKALSSGANDYLRKPVDATTLITKIERHLEENAKAVSP